MTDNPADNQDTPKEAPRRRGRPPGKRNANPSKASAADERARKAAPIQQAPAAPPVLSAPLPPPPPEVLPARPAGGENNRPNGNRTQPNNRGGRYPQGQRGYHNNNNNNHGPRREINPLDRGPRRGQAPQSSQAAPAEGKPAEEGAPVVEPRPQQQPKQNRRSGQQPANSNRNPNQNQNQNPNQNPNQNQNQNPNRAQPRRGRANKSAQDSNRPNPNQNRQGQAESNGANGRGGQPQNNPQKQNSAQNPNRAQPRRGNRPARAGQGSNAAQTAPGELLAREAPQKTQPSVKGLRRSRAVNPFVYNKPPPIKTSSGIKALSQDGTYALSWWAARWIAAMDNLVDGRRLSRGRSYAKEGQVLSIEEKPGGVQAMVQGSRPKPYRVLIEVIPLSDREWKQVFDVLASQALFAAQLLAGEMPRNIEEAFDAAGTSLFPARLGDLHTDCSCPDWANPCKHVAATHYILAERFDEDPFLLFRLRGRTSEQILSALRDRRSGSNGDEPVFEDAPVEEVQPALPLEANLAGFYSMGQPLDDFALSFKAPAIEMPVLKRLGDPNFLGQESLLATMEPVYRSVRASALEAALGEAKEEETAE